MILLTVTHTMESILQQLMEMDVIQAEKMCIRDRNMNDLKQEKQNYGHLKMKL